MSAFKMEPYDPLIHNGGLDDSEFGYPPIIEQHDPDSEIQNGPYLAIIEQPKQRGFRFRYVCEGPSHGGLPGASSEKGKKTYPTVKIFNYVGMAKIEVDLVTHTEPARVHAHSLVGKHANEYGNCVVTVGPKDMTAQFNNLGIVHVTKKSQVDILKEKIRQQLLRQSRGTHVLTERDEKKIEAEVKELKKVTDLSIVRLRFTAYLPDSTGAYTLPLKPVISDPIHDSKSPGASNLRISRMDKISGSVKGGDEVYLLCDKVQKDDIEVRFYEDDENGWQAFGDFSPTDVHKQYAIVFRTPPYHKQKIDRPVTVFLQLKRKRGGDVSDSKQFTYYPLEQDKEEVDRKRRKDLPSLNHFGGGAPMGGGAGGGSGGFGHGGGNNMNFTYGAVHNQFYTHSGGIYQGNYMMNDASPGSSLTTPLLTNVKKEETQASPPQESSASHRTDTVQRAVQQVAHVCNMRMLSLAQRTSKALMDYAVTADPRMLLAVHRPLVATQDKNGDTPLHLAIIHGQTVVVQQMVDVLQGMTNQHMFNMCNNLHQTPLHLGVITKQYQTVNILLKGGADPTILDRYGNSVLHLAVQAGDVRMLQVLLENTLSGYKNLLNMPDYNGLYPVHWAVKVKSEKCLEMLVRSGANVNAAERKSGRNPLHIAVEMDNLNMAISLVKLGADVNAQTFGGNTPLHLAASLGSPVLTRMLISAGANAQIENDEPVRAEASSDSDDTDSESDVQMDTDSDQQGDSDSEDDQENRRISCGVKRRYPGHKPLDLTRSQKVRDILSKHSSGRTARDPAPHEPANILSLETNTVHCLERLLNEGQTGSDWTELASRLRLQSLVDTYRNTSSPTESLLRSYELAGGSLNELIQTLESMGLNEGVELLRKSEVHIKKENQEVKVDSAYGSQSVGSDHSTACEPQKPSPTGSPRLSPTRELAPRTEPASGQ